MCTYNKIIILTFFIILTSCKSDDIIFSAFHTEKPQINYLVEYKEKPLFETDTINTKFEITLFKNILDTTYGYNFKIKNKSFLFYHFNNTSYNFYKNLNTYNVTNKKNQKIIEYLYPLNLLSTEDINDTLNKITKNAKQYIFQKNYKDNKEFKNISKQFIFSKKTNNLSSSSLYLDFQNTNQYTECVYKNITFHSKTNIKKELDSLLSTYNPIKDKTTEAKIITKEDLKTINGDVLGVNKNVSLRDFNQDIIMLDFWYMSCHPCIKSFPTIIEIKNKYLNESFEVIGINAIDNNEKSKNILKGFISENSLNYPTILNTKPITYLNSYPTVIILNKKRDIIYTHTGYSIENENNLKTFLKKLFRTQSKSLYLK
ncbi:hypothetical protein BFP78_04310 [Gaetbulibacter sp. 5U11]|nr:hypothetical protein BFP78_04310 [Gaetbulibacter sp. 5U11]